MSSSASNPDADGSRPFAEPEAGSRPNENHQLLDQVLQETLAMTSPDGPLTQDELDRLVGVARCRHATADVSVDAVVELIQLVLELRFKSVARNTRSLSVMARELAITMRDDPQTWERVGQFWARLCEAAR